MEKYSFRFTFFNK